MLFLVKKTLFFVFGAVFVRKYEKKIVLLSPNMRNLPTMTRYLLIANVAIYLLSSILLRYGIDLNAVGGLHYVSAQSFHFWQPLTYMFLHANFSHLFFNMFAVLMFAPMIEREWGTRRFSIYYLVCGLGAALVQELVWSAMLSNMSAHYSMAELSVYAQLLNTIGASGAVFGILFAFGWLYPDVPMFILFIPIPIRARVFVIIYAVIELFEGLGTVAGLTADNVAHFAHLGGLLFGWLLILYWRKRNWSKPLLFEWFAKLKGLFSSHERLDSSSKGKDFDNYHYHKRV